MREMKNVAYEQKGWWLEGKTDTIMVWNMKFWALKQKAKIKVTCLLIVGVKKHVKFSELFLFHIYLINCN